MKVSVIIPIYKGNKYINGLIRMISRNMDYIRSHGDSIDIDLVLVNDFPDIPLKAEELEKSHDFNILTADNCKNQGIHQTRVNGLKIASGEYILMLDQDDEIPDNCIGSQCAAIGTADIVVGNGYKMIDGKKKLIYKTDKKHSLCKNEKIYLLAANQKVSPGHCLIKKDAIPKEWYEFVVNDNGGDDLFLWLLMFEKKCSFVINRDCVYTHIDTGQNLSLDLEKMYKSSDNVIELCRKSGAVDEKTVCAYERRIRYLREMQSDSKIKKISACIRNIDICFYKLYAYYR